MVSSFGLCVMILAAALAEDHDILDADAEFARNVDARLCGAHSAGRDRPFSLRGVAIRRFVDLETEAVAIAVAEIRRRSQPP